MTVDYVTSFGDTLCLTDCPHSIGNDHIRVGSVNCQRCEFFIDMNKEKHEVECSKELEVRNENRN